MNPLLLLALVSFAVLLARKVYSALARSWNSPLRSLPGPKSPSFIYGHFKEIADAENSVLHEKWVEEYGKTFMYYGFGNTPRLCTMDTRALNHVLTHSEYYFKPPTARAGLARVLGEGLLVVEGEKHRQQRRIMNPAFGPAQLRALTPIFNQKSLELRDVLLSKMGPDGTLRVDVLSWLSRATLDIIGLAGFGYAFDALKSNESKLATAFDTAFRGAQQVSILSVLGAFIPVLSNIPTARGKRIDASRAVMQRIGRELVHERKIEFTNSGKASAMNMGKDLLSLLVKANMEDKQGMSDDDVLAQVPTFLVAGHETTSSATTWALYALCLNPEAQRTLRAELYTLNSDAPGMDELKGLTYLDWVVKETMRVHAPVPGTVRVAMRDDVLPMEDGSVTPIGKGDAVFVPILAMNRSKEIWGEDSFEFKPERWANVPEGATNSPGVWSNLLSFLGGSRACIGYQFSIVEMKCLLFALIRAFEFSLAVPEESIRKKSSIVQQPFLKGEEEAGAQMPLIIKPYSHI